MMRRWAGFATLCLILILPTGCGPQAAFAPASEAATTASPAPTISPQAVADARFGAVFFGPQLNDADLPCDEITRLGIRSSFFGAWWGLIEPEPGHYDWSSVDAVVDAAIACGVEPVIKITTAAAPGQDAHPPADVQTYARFVSSLVLHLKSRVRVYAVENEVDRELTPQWTADTYGQLRAAAYQAVHQSDPEAVVLDSGMTMPAYLLARADELLRAGDAQAAVEMLGRAERSIRRKQISYPSSVQALDKWLAQPKALRIVALVNELYAHPSTFDVVQLHYLQDAWEFLPEYMSWVRMWCDKPIEFWEVGFGSERTGYSEEDHAYGVVKTLIIALGEGAARVIYEPYTEGKNNVGRGLVPPGGARLAATAYQTMTTRLAGYTRAERLDLGDGTWTYRFATPRGDVYVAWAVRAGTVRLPSSGSRVTVTDVAGKSTVADPAAVPVGPGPVFVAADR